jgi:putative oxidoreductase
MRRGREAPAHFSCFTLHGHQGRRSAIVSQAFMLWRAEDLRKMMEDCISSASQISRRRQPLSLAPARPAALLLLRLIIGYGFMAHGYAKLHRGPDKFAALLGFLHVPFPHFAAWFVTVVELVGGFALILGAFVALLSVPLIILHLVAMGTIHVHYGYSSVNTIGLTPQGPLFGPPGFEISLLYIGGILILAAFGPGALSIDGFRTKRGR